MTPTKPPTHGPAPWSLSGQFDAEISVEIVAADGVTIAEIAPFTEDWTEQEIANVHAMKAAPQLLEACRLLVKVGESEQWEFFQVALNGARKAIAAAEGRNV